MAEPGTIIHAQLEVSHCSAEVSINRVPVSRIAWSSTRIPIENVAVAQLLIPGSNTLELVVEPGSTPSLAYSERRELPFKQMSAVARLIRFQDGASGLPEEGEILGEVSFRWDDASVDKQTFPQAIAHQIEMGAASGRWAWQDAPELELSAAVVSEAQAVLGEIEDAIRASQTEKFWSLTELQIRDVLRAFPAITEGYLRSDLAKMFDQYREESDPVMPRDPEKHDFRLVAGNKLLQCVDKDWSTSFKLRDPGDGSAVPYSIFLGRIGGKLRVVR